MPQFWLGLLLIMVLALHLHWLPTSGIGTLSHIIMPAITMALPALARMVMIVRVRDDRRAEPAVRARPRRPKGFPSTTSSASRPAQRRACPFVTLYGWELIRAIAGYTVVVETVFAWPGLGLTAIQAIQRKT